ncbi:YceI family protein [Streptomyces sp. NK08204]|uniref:YceI family protein n=1 Tax=Streptomyces sp. NK08204 TaxID=2873260 RepID=UPI001CEDC9CB|nr:YceI family protein [Streptomyces sp. NK08204]
MTVAVETGLWQLDPAASTVAVRHKHMWGLVAVKGVFTTVGGQGEVKPDGSVTGTVTLDATSLDTKNDKRDAHLRSADFFDAENHPEITFTLHGADVQGDSARVTGELTARGITKPLTFTARLTGVDAQAVTVEAEAKVDREDYGMTFNQLGMITRVSTVTVKLRFTRAQAS